MITSIALITLLALLATPVTLGAAIPGNLQSTGPNVLVYSSNPLENPQAELLAIDQLGDWTSNLSTSDESWRVESLLFQNPVKGLAQPFYTPLFWPTETHILINQSTPTSSRVWSSETTSSSSLPRFVPPPGRYTLRNGKTLQVKVLSTQAPAPKLWVRIGQLPWLAYTQSPTFEIQEDTQFSAYLEVEGIAGPIQSGSYRIHQFAGLQPATLVDQNSNELDDHWEQLTGVTDPHRDEDQDGFDNLAEYQAETDPQDPNSFPGSGSGNLRLLIRLPSASSPPGTKCEIVWNNNNSPLRLYRASEITGPWTRVEEGVAERNGEQIFAVPEDSSGNTGYFRLLPP